MVTEKLQKQEKDVKQILLRVGQCYFKNYKPEQNTKLLKEDIDIIIGSVEKPSEQFIKIINKIQTSYLVILDDLNPDTIEEHVNEGKIDMLMEYMDFIGSHIECASKILEKFGYPDNGRAVYSRKLERVKNASKLNQSQSGPKASKDLSDSESINKPNNQNQYKTYYALGSGAIIGAAIAYLAGAATFTPAIAAVAVFIAATVVGALVGYGIGKFCEKVSEEKQNDPDMSMCTAIKNVLTPECLKSQSQVHP